MEVSIIGTGYVGLVTGACLAQLGNRVICADNDTDKIMQLKKLRMPIYEPGLEEMVHSNVEEGRLIFTNRIADAVKRSLVIFIAVGTPPRENGEADLTGVEHVARSIGKSMHTYHLIVEKSTVPVETGVWMERTIRINLAKNVPFDVASNPEFLREGSAIEDFMHPDRIVVGVNSEKAKELLLKLYQPLKAPILVTDIKSAEIIKHASNSFLATKLSFINAISQVCDRVGADVTKVAEGIGLDKRIAPGYLNAGLGYGGSCLPKDIEAFIRISEKVGYDFKLLKVIREINEEQKGSFFDKIEKALWVLREKTIGIMGLSFKPQTDDLRQAPSLDIIAMLQKEGVKVKVFDPQAMPKVKEKLKGVRFSKDVYDLAKGCDCLVLVTEWDEFKALNFERIKRLMKQPIIVDGRNVYDRAHLEKLGFIYLCIGR